MTGGVITPVSRANQSSVTGAGEPCAPKAGPRDDATQSFNLFFFSNNKTGYCDSRGTIVSKFLRVGILPYKFFFNKNITFFLKRQLQFLTVLSNIILDLSKLCSLRII